MSTPEQPSVDWLDEGRESCLIDGVRYTREGSEDGIELIEDMIGYGGVLMLSVNEQRGAFRQARASLRGGARREATTIREATQRLADFVLVPTDQHTQGER